MKGCGLAKGKKVRIRAVGWKGWLLFTSLWLYPSIAAAGGLTLSWSANTESDLAGYKVYFGIATKSYGTPIDVKNVTTYTVTGLDEKKTYYFVVTAYDQTGNESAFSTEVFGTVPDKTAPSAPTGLIVK